MKNLKKALFFIVTPLLVLLVSKMLFVSFTPYEEYQIVMSFRLTNGGKLFYDVYDTIQSSGFLDAILIKFFIFLTGSTTGVVIYLRAMGLLIKGLVSVVFYKTAKRYVKNEIAALLSLIFFVTFPKMIASPDFSSLQLDFTVLMICFFDSGLFYSESKKTFMEILCLILSALCLCGCILSGDSSHGLGATITGDSVLKSFVKNSLLILCLLAVDAILSYLITVLLKKRNAFSAVFLNISFLFTLYFWFIKKEGYDGLKLFIPAIFLVSIIKLIENRQIDTEYLTFFIKEK